MSALGRRGYGAAVRPTAATIAIRADAGLGRGSGHVARQFALAEAWLARGGRATLVGEPAHWRDRFTDLGVEVVASTNGTDVEPDWWVVDGYDLSVPTTVASVLVVDDFGLGGHRGADLVLDQNLGVAAQTYAPTAATLLGPRYALLREEVRLAARARHGSGQGCVLVVVGGLPSPAVATWAAAVAADLERSGIPVEVLDGRRSIEEALGKATVAVAAAGSVCWELLHVGIATVVVSVAENQRRLAAALAAAGVAEDLGPIEPLVPAAASDAAAILLADDRRRDELVATGHRLVDGLGAARVATRLRARCLHVREATPADAQQLLAWRNDPATVAASVQASTVAWEDHVTWLERTLLSESTDLLIVEEQGTPIGTARFDRRASGRVEISVTVAPDHRGRSLAAPLIDAACAWRGSRAGPLEVSAQVKPENAASSAAFQAADFDVATPRAGGNLRYARVLHGVR